MDNLEKHLAELEKADKSERHGDFDLWAEQMAQASEYLWLSDEENDITKNGDDTNE